MAESLSQADIDSLLDTFSEAEGRVTGRATASARKSSESYDFSHPDILSRDQARAIRTLHEGYAQALAKKFSTEFLSNVSATVVAVDHLTYAEFLMLLPTPTVLSVIEIPELEGNAAIELNPGLAFSFIDRLLGGVGHSIAKVRALTAIEQGLMERALSKACQELELIWSQVMDLTFRLQSIEGNPELARVVGPDEMIVLVSMELTMNEAKGMLNLCLPYVVMEPAINRLGQVHVYPRSVKHSTTTVRDALEKSVQASSMDVEVRIGETAVTFRELLELEVGDVLQITPAAETGAAAFVQGVPRLVGSPGRHRGRLAFRVQETHPRTDGGQKEKGR